MLLRMLSKCLILNGNIGITFRKYGLTLYDNDACIKCAVHKAFLDYCNGIPRNWLYIVIVLYIIYCLYMHIPIFLFAI